MKDKDECNIFKRNPDGCGILKLEKQLGICGSFENKPVCNKCRCKEGSQVMELSDDKYVCPRCGHILKVDTFKAYLNLME